MRKATGRADRAQRAHTMCLCSPLLFYSKCTGFTVCFYYMEQSTANSNSFKIAQKTAFEAKGRLYTKGNVIQLFFIIDLYT